MYWHEFLCKVRHYCTGVYIYVQGLAKQRNTLSNNFYPVHSSTHFGIVHKKEMHNGQSQYGLSCLLSALNCPCTHYILALVKHGKSVNAKIMHITCIK